MDAIIDLCDSPSPEKRLPLRRRRSNRLNPNINNENEFDDEPATKPKAKRTKRTRSNGRSNTRQRDILRDFFPGVREGAKMKASFDPFEDSPAAGTRYSGRSNTRQRDISRDFFSRVRKGSKRKASFDPFEDTPPTKAIRPSSRGASKALRNFFGNKAKSKAKSKTLTKSKDHLYKNGFLDGESPSPAKSNNRGKQSAARKPQKKVHHDDDLDFDSDIQVVEKPVERPMVRPKKAAEKSAAKETDDEVSVLGVIGDNNVLVNCPHSREDCVVESFTQGNHSSYCKTCYCFVCEVPANKCKSWKTGPKGKEGHCHATCKDPKWLAIKKEIREGGNAE